MLLSDENVWISVLYVSEIKAVFRFDQFSLDINPKNSLK